MKKLLFVSVLLIGCGGGEGFTASSNIAGEAGETGLTGGTSGTGGTAGSSVGGNTTGGLEETGGASGSVSTGGNTGGSGGGCVPKTCATRAVELDTFWQEGDPVGPQACGSVSDGCNGFLNCGECDAGWSCGKATASRNNYAAAYAGSLSDYLNYRETDSIPNICRPTCVDYGTLVATPELTGCPATNPNILVCSEAPYRVSNPYPERCIHVPTTTLSYGIWCCQ